MKKVLCVILSLVMSFTIPSAVTASSFDCMDSNLPDNFSSIKEMFQCAVAASLNTPAAINTDEVGSICTTTLKNQFGEVYDVQMFEYIPETAANESEFSKTFVYSTSVEYVNPRGSNSMNAGEWDSSISVYGYLTIEYNKISWNSTDSYLLTKVIGGWERDDYRVTITDRYVAYTCQNVFVQDQVTHCAPTSDTFTYNTNYSQYIDDDSTTSVLGACSIADLAHGSSSRWELTTRVMVLENDIGDLIFA